MPSISAHAITTVHGGPSSKSSLTSITHAITSRPVTTQDSVEPSLTSTRSSTAPAASQSAATQDASGSSSKPHITAIGAAIGGIIGALIIGLVIWYFFFSKYALDKKQRQKVEKHMVRMAENYAEKRVERMAEGYADSLQNGQSSILSNGVDSMKSLLPFSSPSSPMLPTDNASAGTAQDSAYAPVWNVMHDVFSSPHTHDPPTSKPTHPSRQEPSSDAAPSPTSLTSPPAIYSTQGKHHSPHSPHSPGSPHQTTGSHSGTHHNHFHIPPVAKKAALRLASHAVKDFIHSETRDADGSANDSADGTGSDYGDGEEDSQQPAQNDYPNDVNASNGNGGGFFRTPYGQPWGT
jgi:hypothetical protein